MYTGLESYRRVIGSVKITVISFTAFMVSQAAIASITHDLGSDFLAIQLTLSHERFLTIASGWQSAGLMPVYCRHFYLDYLHPVFYSVFLSSFMALAFARRGVSSKYNVILFLPFLAALLDMVENSFHIYMLLDFTRITAGMVMMSGICTWVKWTVSFLCFLIALVICCVARKKLDGRNAG